MKIKYNEYAENKGSAIKVDLSLITNPLQTKVDVKRIVEECLLDINNYYYENKELISEIAKQNGLKDGNVMISDGADGALTLISLAFFENKKVVIPLPSFPRFEFYALLGRGTLLFIQPKDNICLDTEKMLEADGDILLFANPNNPTGFVVDEMVIRKALEKYELVVLDEALILNRGYEKLINEYNNLLITRSFSKSYGLAALRIGYCLGNAERISKITSLSSPFKVNKLAQLIALAILRDANYLENLSNYLEQEKIFLYNQLKDENILKSKSICYLLKINKQQEQKLAEKGINVILGNHFKIDGFCRVAVGLRKDNILLIDALKENKEEVMLGPKGALT